MHAILFLLPVLFFPYALNANPVNEIVYKQSNEIYNLHNIILILRDILPQKASITRFKAFFKSNSFT